ncbi:MAG: FAD:protein FMN transferase [Paludibacteraceae bacterium]
MKLKYFLISIAFIFVQCKPAKSKYVFNEGSVFGTYYHITYDMPEGKDRKPEIEKRFEEFNRSLSTFDPNSIISRINRNDSTVCTDQYFEDMFKMAKEVSEKSGGAFDITVSFG